MKMSKLKNYNYFLKNYGALFAGVAGFISTVLLGMVIGNRKKKRN